MKTRKKLTYQERNRRRMERAAKALRIKTLLIPIRNDREREYLRERIGYSGASDTYIASYVEMFPLASVLLMKLRKKNCAQLYVNAEGCFTLVTGQLV